MTERPLTVDPEEEATLIGQWIVQLIHKELAGYLDTAQQQENATLVISLGPTATDILRTALSLRADAQGLTGQSSS